MIRSFSIFIMAFSETSLSTYFRTRHCGQRPDNTKDEMSSPTFILPIQQLNAILTNTNKNTIHLLHRIVLWQ